MTDGSSTYPARLTSASGVTVLEQASVVDVGESEVDVSRAISPAPGGTAAGAAKMLSRHRADTTRASGTELYIFEWRAGWGGRSVTVVPRRMLQ